MRGYRVWSDYWERYSFDAELYADGTLYAMFEDDDGVTHHENTDLVVEFDTGYKDRNGKEIYKRDIVRVFYGDNYEVKQFCTGAWRIGRDELYKWANGSEVIGNIHENTELLEEE